MRLQRELAEAFPNVAALDVTQVQQAVEGIVERVSRAIRFIALFSLATGALVLLGALATSRYQRVREAVLLKTLGATRRQVLQIACVEYLGLGLLGASTALVLSIAGGLGAGALRLRRTLHHPAGAVVDALARGGGPHGRGRPAQQPGPVPPHAARGPARRMKRSDWSLIRIALALGLLPGILLVAYCPRNNSWPIVNHTPQGVAVVAFGDSLTAGYQVADTESYPAQLAKLLDREIVNRGVSGDTAAEGLARLDRDVLSENPRVVLLSLGANDMLRRQPIEDTFANLRRIVDRIQARGALVILIGVEGYPLVHGDWGKRYRDLARETGCVYVPDILDDVIGDPGLMYDQIHPNAAGYAKIAQRIQSEAGEYLNRYEVEARRHS